MITAMQDSLKGHQAYASYQMHAWEELSRSSVKALTPITNSPLKHCEIKWIHMSWYIHSSWCIYWQIYILLVKQIMSEVRSQLMFVGLPTTVHAPTGIGWVLAILPYTYKQSLYIKPLSDIPHLFLYLEHYDLLAHCCKYLSGWSYIPESFAQALQGTPTISDPPVVGWSINYWGFSYRYRP
jgi:hypothetical protein